MAMDIISTKGVAEVLGVSEATVKRWADAGTLKCFRTAGGHRKFRLRDVRAFLTDQMDSPDAVGEASVGLAAELTREQLEARALALSSDVDALVSLIARERMRGRSLAHVFDEVIAPAMSQIGESWAAGKLTTAQEHVASNALIETIARVRPLIERPSTRYRGRAICTCLGDEQHDIGVRVVGLILAAEGFRTSMLGGNVPTSDIARMVASEQPALVALSASGHANLERLRSDIAIVAGAAAASQTRVLAGGHGFARLASVPSNVSRFFKLQEFVTLVKEPNG